MAANLSDQLALFTQYDGEYCSKATDVASKIQAIASLSGGESERPPASPPKFQAAGLTTRSYTHAELRRAKQREVQSDLEEAAQTVGHLDVCSLTGELVHVVWEGCA